MVQPDDNQRATMVLDQTLAPFQAGRALPEYARPRFIEAKRDLGGFLGMLLAKERGEDWVTPDVLGYGSRKGLDSIATLKRLADSANIQAASLDILADVATRNLRELEN